LVRLTAKICGDSLKGFESYWGLTATRFPPVAAPGRQDRQVTAGAIRQVSLVSGQSVYAMDDLSRFSKLANNIVQMFNRSGRLLIGTITQAIF